MALGCRLFNHGRTRRSWTGSGGRDGRARGAAVDSAFENGAAAAEKWSAVEKGSRLAHQIGVVEEIEKNGAKVVAAAVDVADEQQLSSFLNQYRESGGAPIRGVVHAAGVVGLQPVAALDGATLHATLRPKIAGGWLLHRLLEPEDSISLCCSRCLRHCSARRSWGLMRRPTLFWTRWRITESRRGGRAWRVNWAAWSGERMAARYLEGGACPGARGRELHAGTGLAVLGRLLRQGLGAGWSDASGVADLVQAVSRVQFVAGHQRTGERGNECGGIQWQTKGEPIRAMLLAAAAEDRHRVLEDYLHHSTARVLGLAGSKLKAQRSLTSLGFDSLMAVELRNTVETDLEVSLPLVDILQGPSVEQLSNRLLEQVLASSLVSKAEEPAGSSKQEDDWEMLTL